ncbi:MAG: hypothetical protein ACYDDC_00030 [Thermoplasmataceae archaeon]
MINQKVSYGKVIKVSTEDYNELHDLKFELREDTFGDVIKVLIKEHRHKQEVEA